MRLGLPGKGLFLLLMMVLMLGGSMAHAGAVEVGGRIDLQAGMLYDQDFFGNYQGSGELELYLPRGENFASRLVLRGHLNEGGPELGVKYMYLRYRHQYGHITLGRQPISWSYGSLIHPLDYKPGVEGLAGETIQPEVDGVRILQNMGNGASLHFAVSFPEGLTRQPLHRMGLGGRLRVMLPDHDFSLNVIDQPLQLFPLPGEDNLFRAGLTYRGDAGPAGFYGAISYFRLRHRGDEDVVAQVGADFSWQVGPEYQESLVYFQAEYLRFLLGELGLNHLMQAGAGPGLMGGIPAEFHDLLLVNLNLEIDPFSQVGTALIFETTDYQLALAPYFESDLGGGVELRLEGSLLWDREGVFSGGSNLGLTFYF